jgi:2,3-bisphosphoglycerate-independent phosphoglycerate mutase
VVLAIMDGIGVGPGGPTDAVATAHTPNLDALRTTALSTTLRAHGKAVGMPSDADMGNSEVGHNAMGAGRIFDQGAKRVAEAVQSGALFKGALWQRLVDQVSQAKPGQAAMHCIGLLSDGNVHSHIDHLLAMATAAGAAGVKRFYAHVLLDGRDVDRTSALVYVNRLEDCFAGLRQQYGADYAIASGGGRMQISMDRYEADWSMVARGWRTHVEGEVSALEKGGPAGRFCDSATAAIAEMRQEQADVSDQDLGAFVVQRNGRPLGPIRDGDAVIAFNFRGDRMLELVRAFEEEEFTGFARAHRPNVLFAGMTQYDGDTQRPKNFLVAPPQIDRPLSELLCAAKVRQWACSETQKFGHVTYFWNGNRSEAFDRKLETYVEVPSVAPPFDASPQMSAAPISAKVRGALGAGAADFYRVNFANGDMVGHTGKFAPTVLAVEAVDRCLGELREAVRSAGGTLVVTGDHGNAEQMAEADASGALRPKTSHSLNPVPLLVEGEAIQSAVQQHLRQWAPTPSSGLANLASTLCVLLGFDPPADYLPSVLL